MARCIGARSSGTAVRLRGVADWRQGRAPARSTGRYRHQRCSPLPFFSFFFHSFLLHFFGSFLLPCWRWSPWGSGCDWPAGGTTIEEQRLVRHGSAVARAARADGSWAMPGVASFFSSSLFFPLSLSLVRVLPTWCGVAAGSCCHGAAICGELTRMRGHA